MSDLAAGRYKARGIEGSGQKGVSTGGVNQVAVDVEIVEGEHKGHTLTTFLYFSRDAAPYSRDRLKALGCTSADLSGLSTNEVTIEVKYEEYQGEQKMRVEILTGGGRVTLKEPLEGAALRAFDSELDALMMTSAKPSKAPKSGAAPYPKDWDDTKRVNLED